MMNEMMKAVGDIDITNVDTGEIIEIFKNVWLGDLKKTISPYKDKVVKIERDAYREDDFIVWVKID